MIQLEKSKSGVMTAKYKGKYIHSRYDPVSEGERFAKNNLRKIDNKIVPVYGLGLGYHIQAMADYVGKECLIYVFEYNKEMVELSKKINPQIFLNHKIKIFTSNNVNFFNELSKAIKDFGDLIIYKPSLETIKDYNSRLYNLIYDFSITKQYSAMDREIVWQSEENVEANRKIESYSIEQFVEKNVCKDKPFLIVSAGPSVDDDLEILKKAYNKFTVICVGSVLRTLVNSGIKPDAVVIIDTKEIVKKQFEGLEEAAKDIDLCFAAAASKEAVAFYPGPKYMFNGYNSSVTITTGGTVAIAAMDIALKCGCSKMIFLGQDLAFIGSKSHTNTFEKTYGFEDDYKNHVKYEKVKGINGETLYTLKGYLRFKNKIESLIRSNNKTEFINCSKGAFIEGAAHVSFEEVVNKIKG